MCCRIWREDGIGNRQRRAGLHTGLAPPAGLVLSANDMRLAGCCAMHGRTEHMLSARMRRESNALRRDMIITDIRGCGNSVIAFYVARPALLFQGSTQPSGSSMHARTNTCCESGNNLHLPTLHTLD